MRLPRKREPISLSLMEQKFYPIETNLRKNIEGDEFNAIFNVPFEKSYRLEYIEFNVSILSKLILGRRDIYLYK